MELSDNPHAVGTVEHKRWIVDEYIPSLTDDQKEQHRKRAGAEAIGAKLIDESRRFTFSLGGVDLSELVKSASFTTAAPEPAFKYDWLIDQYGKVQSGRTRFTDVTNV